MKQMIEKYFNRVSAGDLLGRKFHLTKKSHRIEFFHQYVRSVDIEVEISNLNRSTNFRNWNTVDLSRMEHPVQSITFNI